MAGTRSAPNTITDPSGIAGDAYAVRMKAETDNLWNGIVTQTTDVAGTNTITAVSVPPLIADPVHGQTFRITPANNNTGAVTFNPDGRGAVAVKDIDGGALAADDLVADRPVLLWYDADIGFYRLQSKTERELIAALAASIAAATFWEVIGDTTVSAAVASIEHTFTAGDYSHIRVELSGLSPANATVTLAVALRRSGASIVTLTTVETFNAADTGTLNAVFDIDLVSATKLHFGVLNGATSQGAGAVLAEVKAFGSHATAPDRVRAIYSAGNIDAGRMMTYGLKVPA